MAKVRPRSSLLVSLIEYKLAWVTVPEYTRTLIALDSNFKMLYPKNGEASTLEIEIRYSN